MPELCRSVLASTAILPTRCRADLGEARGAQGKASPVCPSQLLLQAGARSLCHSGAGPAQGPQPLLQPPEASATATKPPGASAPRHTLQGTGTGQGTDTGQAGARCAQGAWLCRQPYSKPTLTPPARSPHALHRASATPGTCLSPQCPHRPLGAWHRALVAHGPAAVAFVWARDARHGRCHSHSYLR